ncbi:methyltransferase domain-containing protein [Halorubraceae archaeon YAN]|nr:methyltransferase domain-containing protein [Halorubraceae archaeon YAN]
MIPTDTDPRSWLDQRELEQLAERVENGSIRDATRITLANHDYQTEEMQEIFDINQDSWRILTSQNISGRCLDLSAGYGRRSMALAEIVDEVYAVDVNLSKLRVLSAREDHDSCQNVIPIHAELDQLPFPPGNFDTIVADFTCSNGRNLRERVSRLRRYLSDDGSLILILDGWTRRLGIPRLVGLERQPPNYGDFSPATPSGYRSVLRSAGFETMAIYVLFPTAHSVEYVFEVGNEHGVRALRQQIKSSLTDGDRRRNALQTAMWFGEQTGALDYCYPSYCVVGCPKESSQSDSNSVGFKNPFLISGRTRSVVFDFGSNGINRVSKIPNRTEHISMTERENHVLSELRTKNKPIVDTLPSGQSARSKFGTVRHETPIDGQPLKNQIGGDIESFRQTLQTGYDWLAEFQQTFRGETVMRSPKEINSDLSFSPLDLYSPEITNSVQLFRTPVHGDYLAGNVYVRDKTVTNVIDWEYGALSGWPIIDAGLFPLNLAKYVFGGVEDGFRALFCTDTEYAKVTEEIIRNYCDSVGLTYRAFLQYLPSVYLHRMKIDWRHNTMNTHSKKLKKRISRVELLRTVPIDSTDSK